MNEEILTIKDGDTPMQRLSKMHCTIGAILERRGYDETITDEAYIVCPFTLYRLRDLEEAQDKQFNKLYPGFTRDAPIHMETEWDDFVVGYYLPIVNIYYEILGLIKSR